MARSKSKKGQVPSELTLSVLGYREEGEWVAVALEMDLRGYGSTFAHAATELAELVTTQIDFARFKGQPELIWKPAEPVYWTLFENTRRNHFYELVSSSTPRNPNYAVGGLALPPPHVIARLPQFRQSRA